MPRPWIVRKHDALEKLEPDLWAVESDIRPGSRIRRRMMIARLADGRLVFLNAVPLGDEAMRELESWGTPAFLCVPAGYHTLDVAPFKARYPQLRILAGEGFRARVAKQVPVDGGWEQLPADARIRAIPIRGARGEMALHAGGTLCLPGDVMMDLPHLPGMEGFLWRILGSTGSPRVTNVAKLFVVSDRAALKAHLLELAQLPGLERLAPCHGAVTRSDAARVLREVAGTL
jgi:hypothetical protein